MLASKSTARMRACAESAKAAPLVVTASNSAEGAELGEHTQGLAAKSYRGRNRRRGGSRARSACQAAGQAACGQSSGRPLPSISRPALAAVRLASQRNSMRPVSQRPRLAVSKAIVRPAALLGQAIRRKLRDAPGLRDPVAAESKDVAIRSVDQLPGRMRFCSHLDCLNLARYGERQELKEQIPGWHCYQLFTGISSACGSCQRCRSPGSAFATASRSRGKLR